MSEYPKVIELPYKVFTGVANGYSGRVNWSHLRSFSLESDAEVHAERFSEDYEFVKIEKKENN